MTLVGLRRSRSFSYFTRDTYVLSEKEGGCSRVRRGVRFFPFVSSTRARVPVRLPVPPVVGARSLPSGEGLPG